MDNMLNYAHSVQIFLHVGNVWRYLDILENLREHSKDSGDFKSSEGLWTLTDFFKDLRCLKNFRIFSRTSEIFYNSRTQRSISSTSGPFPSLSHTYSLCDGAITSFTVQHRYLLPNRTSTRSLSKNRSLMKPNTSSSISDTADRFVIEAVTIIGPLTDRGNCRNISFASCSDSSASAYVRLGFPVNAHVHTIELVSMTRSK